MMNRFGFPPDKYTPHGYLDNPFHTFRQHPSGVLRSLAPIGFAWHYPALAGPYNRRRIYVAGLRIGLEVEGKLLLTEEDLRSAGARLWASEHSQNVFTYRLAIDSLALSATFFLVGEDALGCTVELAGDPGPPPGTRCLFIVDYVRAIGVSGLWEDGLVAARDAPSGALVVSGYAEGTAFALAAPRGAELGVGRSLEDLRQLPVALPYHVRPAEGRGDVRLVGVAGVEAWPRLRAVLGRAERPDAAVAAADQGLRRAASELRVRRRSDAAFWARCPRLSGDWPDYWRRGLVYDFETLRLVVRPPAGIFREPWDGMQIQAPRLVLAEAALDLLMLGYADPDLAKRSLLGSFRDAPGANVPCCREDGSVNMVAEDGSACGTAPEWCYPFYCLDSLYARTGDRAWLEAIYPHAAAYLQWWLEHRSGDEGWLHYLCSWESGQDCSPRFGAQETGGKLIRQYRPPDLHAAVAQAARILATFAEELGQAGVARRWRAIARRYQEKTRQLWNGERFADWDAENARWVEVDDAMLLAPVFCGVASLEQVATLRGRLTNPPRHGIFPVLQWCPPAWTAIEAAWAAGHRLRSAELALELIERVYRAQDAAEASPDGPVPGVSCEHWPRTSGRAGCEGYGWGALGILLTIRQIAGFREGGELPIVAPALPPDLAVPGRRYRVGPLAYRGLAAHLELQPSEADCLTIRLEYRASPVGCLGAVDGAGRLLARSARPARAGSLSWRVKNGEISRLVWL